MVVLPEVAIALAASIEISTSNARVPRELIEKEGTDATYPTHNLDSIADRRSAGVALQHRLGILPEWWPCSINHIASRVAPIVSKRSRFVGSQPGRPTSGLRSYRSEHVRIAEEHPTAVWLFAENRQDVSCTLLGRAAL